MKKSIDQEWRESLTELQEDELLRQSLQQKFDAELRQRWWKQLSSDSASSIRPAQMRARQYKIWWATAASLLLIISAAIWLFSEPRLPENTRLANTFLGEIANQATDIYMGPNNDSDAWQSAQDHFVKLQFDEAAREVESLANSKPLTAKHLFFLSLCYLQKDPPAFDPALARLQAAREINQGKKAPEFVEEIEWVEALALMLKGDRIAAQTQLQRIVQADGWFSEKAKSLLKTRD